MDIDECINNVKLNVSDNVNNNVIMILFKQLVYFQGWVVIH